MTYTTPFTAVPLAIIAASDHNTSIRDNIIHLNNRTGGDPGGAGKLLVSTGTATGAWGNGQDITTPPILGNNTALQAKHSSGAATYGLIKANSSNNLDVGDANWGNVNIQGGGSLQWTKTGAGTYTVYTTETPVAVLASGPTFTGNVTAPRHIASAGGSPSNPAFTPTTGYGIYAQSSSSLTFAANGAMAGEVTNSGNLSWLFAMSATAFNVVPSDRRAKTNIQKVERAVIDKLRRVPVVSYELNRDGSKHIGVIAQDLQRDFPELVTDHNEGHGDMLGIDLVGLCAMLLRGQQELGERLAAVERVG